MKYTAHVFGCLPTGGYVPCERLIDVNASSLDDALPLIEQQTRDFLPESRFPQVHIDRVYQGKNLVYETAWDETGLLGFVRNVA